LDRSDFSSLIFKIKSDVITSSRSRINETIYEEGASKGSNYRRRTIEYDVPLEIINEGTYYFLTVESNTSDWDDQWVKGIQIFYTKR